VAALADEGFMDRTRSRPPLYGDGRAAERIVAALERLDEASRRGLATSTTSPPQEVVIP
jgi:hypothetical protein